MLRVVCLSLAVCAIAATAVRAQEEAVSLKRSDVVFMGGREKGIYEALSATVVSWGGHADPDKESAANWFLKRVRTAREMGIRYLPGAAFRTAFARMIDYDENFMDSVCRTLDGEPILVPWLWDHKHNGHPAYWFCTNAPDYREYLRHQISRSFEADADGLHIDDYGGTSGTHSQGGCFCPHCMAAFREYVKANVPAERLAELGIGDLDAFDYGAFLRGQGVTTEQFRKEAASGVEKIPLSHAFIAFELDASVAWVAEYRRYCEGLAGHPLALCVNSSVSSPQSLRVAPVVTFFSGEVHHDAEKDGLSTTPIWTYKLCDAVGRPMAATAAGQDWAFVNEHGKPGLVRAWIAQAYAFGHQFMPPVHQWCYTKEKGTHWYDAPTEEFAGICRFVRERADLLDGYDAVAPVGLLYSNAAVRRYQYQVREACKALALANVPFRLVPAGDDWMADRLEADDLAGLKALVYTEPTDLDAAQQAVLDGAAAVAVKWPDQARLAQLVPPMTEVTGAEGVTVVPRAKPGDAAAPFVCHLVNRNYVLETDSPTPQRQFVLKLSDELFGAPITGATLYAPGRAPVTLTVIRATGAAKMPISELDLWAVLALDHQ